MNRGPPAPKPVTTLSASPFSATLLLKTSGLSQDLVVPRSVKMCLSMHRVPRIFTILVAAHHNMYLSVTLADARDGHRAESRCIGTNLENARPNPICEIYEANKQTAVRLKRIHRNRHYIPEAVPFFRERSPMRTRGVPHISASGSVHQCFEKSCSLSEFPTV